MSCLVGHRLCSDPLLLWLLPRLLATAQIHLLAWEFSYAVGIALRDKTKQNKTKTKKGKQLSKYPSCFCIFFFLSNATIHFLLCQESLICHRFSKIFHFNNRCLVKHCLPDLFWPFILTIYYWFVKIKSSLSLHLAREDWDLKKVESSRHLSYKVFLFSNTL